MRAVTATASTPPGLLMVGDYLHASCSDAIYGEVVGLGTDANGAPCVDLRIFDADDILSWPAAEDEKGQLGNQAWPAFTGLATVDLPPGVTIVLRHLHYKASKVEQEPERYRWGKAEAGNSATHGDAATHVSTGRNVEVLTPGNGCFRCTKFFSVARRP